MRLRSSPPVLLLLLSVTLLLSLAAFAADAPKAAPPVLAKGAAVSFQGQIVPMLGKYCVECHGKTKPKAGLNLASLTDESAIARDRKVWQRVVEYVEGGDMPPEGKPRPGRDAVALLTSWIETKLTQVDCAKESDPGRVTLRRLNRAEYNNTIRDLFGLDLRLADDFPSDDVGYGFDNIGDVLTLPPMLLEKYLAAAEAIAGQAIVAGGPSPGPTRIWETETLEGNSGGSTFEDWARILASSGEIATTHTFTRDGEYRLRARAFGQQAGNEPVRMGFLIDGKPIKAVEVAAEQEAPKLYEVKAKLRAGQRRFSVAFLNDFYDEKFPDPRRRDRNLVVDYLEVQGPLASATAPLPESHKRILFRKPTRATRNECAREVIERFTSRAYRRPATAGEVGRLIKFVDLAEQNGDSFERGIQLAVEAVLVSPQFLFRVELDPRGRQRGKAPAPSSHPINEFELASRLSYFLWSSMPDEELYQLALDGKLRAGANLETQVRRMLRDPRSRALVENFGDQWLQVRNLRTISPDKARFPSFDEPLRAAMQKETELFVEAIIREDRSVLEFLDAGFTFLNERLAKHYGITRVKGERFRRVALNPSDHRGGLLTQASVLAVTSNPTRTSPVKRGKWILEQVLGAPPPAPPPDVPELKDDQATALSGTLRQRMEQHRANPACASCHARMDPLGFGFENYDAVGAWRDKDGAFAIDASGTLPSGQVFQGPEALKAILKTRQKEFVRCLAEKLLTYAIGRGLDYYDRCAVDRVVEAMGRDHDKFSRLVLEIVKSEPFQKRKNRGA